MEQVAAARIKALRRFSGMATFPQLCARLSQKLVPVSASAEYFGLALRAATAA